MNTGIYIIRTSNDDNVFFMNTFSNKYTKRINLPYSQGDGQISGFTFTEEEKNLFIIRLVNDYLLSEDYFKVNQVYFNKNNTMVIID